MIEYFTGSARAENKERSKRYFLEYDVNGDGVLQRDEVAQAVSGICEAFLMTPPLLTKVDALIAKTDKNGDGVLSTDEWTSLYNLLVKSALQQATAVVEQQKADLAAAAARAKEAAARAAAEAARAAARPSTKGQGPKVKAKRPPKPPSRSSGINGFVTDTRGAACLFRFVCQTCQHQWDGAGCDMPRNGTCPGCGQVWPVVNCGWAM